MVRKIVVVATLVTLVSVPSSIAGGDEPEAILVAASTPDGFDLQWTVQGDADDITSFTLHWRIDGEAQPDMAIPASARGWFVGVEDDNGFMHEFQLTVNTDEGEVSVSNTAYATKYPHCDVINLEEFPFIFPSCLLPPPIP